MVACYLSVLNGRKLGNNMVGVKPHSQEAEGMGWGKGGGAGGQGALTHFPREKGRRRRATLGMA